MTSSGFLRVSVTTYLGGRRPEWIETQKAKIGDVLPEIINSIMAAGPALEHRKRDREEREKQHREEETRRYEARRLREIDDKRWHKFREFAANGEECDRLRAFIAEIEKRASVEGELTVGGIPLSDWIAWAKERVKALDPLRLGVSGVFDAISKVSHWS